MPFAHSAEAVDFSPVTEVPGIRVTRENLAMAVSRYALAASLADGADVLEVGCGRGQGLRWLADRARRVVGGDFTASLLRGARDSAAGIPLVRLNAEELPFRDASFDLVLLLEAIYYLPDASRFARECRRVLRPGGVVLVCAANPALADFNPSPFSTRYLTASALGALLESAGFDVELSAAFPGSTGTTIARVRALVKRLAVRLRLMPRTMRGKAWLKRLFLGPLMPYPAELHERLAPVARRHSIASVDDSAAFKVLYAVGRSQTC